MQENRVQNFGNLTTHPRLLSRQFYVCKLNTRKSRIGNRHTPIWYETHGCVPCTKDTLLYASNACRVN